jgi:hypothetical protein
LTLPRLFRLKSNYKDRFTNKKFENVILEFFYLLIILVGHTRENWNCIFDELLVLYERLDELDIEKSWNHLPNQAFEVFKMVIFLAEPDWSFEIAN